MIWRNMRLCGLVVFLELRGRTHCWNRNGKKVNWMNEKGCILPGTKIGIVMTMTIMKMSKMQTLMCLQKSAIFP